MKFKSKLILFVFAFALIFSVLSVSCFAYVSTIEVGDTYVFSSNIVVEDDNGEFFDFDASGDIVINIDGDSCNQFYVSEGTVTISGQYTYFYSYTPGAGWHWLRTDSDGNSIVLYTLEFTVEYVSNLIHFPFIEWLSGNVWFASSDSFYDNLYSSISDGVFGVGAQLTPEQVMTLTLISTILSYAFILLPLLFVIGFVLRCFRL